MTAPGRSSLPLIFIFVLGGGERAPSHESPGEARRGPMRLPPGIRECFTPPDEPRPQRAEKAHGHLSQWLAIAVAAIGGIAPVLSYALGSAARLCGSLRARRRFACWPVPSYISSHAGSSGTSLREQSGISPAV